MTDALKGSPALQDCWEGFRHLLHMIETLFGDLFDSPAWVRRADALEAQRWLRDAEYVARTLLLAMARTMTATLARMRARPRTVRAGDVRQSRFDLLTRVRRAPRRRVRATISPRLQALRAAQRAEDAWRRRMFGHAPANALVRIADASPFLRVESKSAPDCAIGHRRRDAASDIVDRRVLARRFNGLVRVLQRPDPYARRLARRLAQDRAATVARAIARTPTHPRNRPPPADRLARTALALVQPVKGADDG
jgi:hypothetical protein